MTNVNSRERDRQQRLVMTNVSSRDTDNTDW